MLSNTEYHILPSESSYIFLMKVLGADVAKDVSGVQSALTIARFLVVCQLYDVKSHAMRYFPVDSLIILYMSAHAHATPVPTAKGVYVVPSVLLIPIIQFLVAQLTVENVPHTT